MTNRSSVYELINEVVYYVIPLKQILAWFKEIQLAKKCKASFMNAFNEFTTHVKQSPN